jgi:hypothetical protein
MAYCCRAFYLFQSFGVKDLAHKAHTLTVVNSPVLGCRYTRAFLPPVLEGKEAVIDQGHSLAAGVREKHAEDPAMVMEFII